jgi:hypothetical protein
MQGTAWAGLRLACSGSGDVDQNQGARPCRCQTGWLMGNVVFKCPATGLNVQHWLADEPPADDPQCTFETVVCQACGRLHFINRSSGKLLGEKEP